MSGVGASDKEKTTTAVEGRVSRRSHVLRSRADFERVLRLGCRIASRNFVLRAGPNHAAQPRLGIIAGRKSAPRAVDRNRAKRLVREAFRTASSGLDGYDITIQLRCDLRGQLNAAIREELQTLLDTFARRIARNG